MPGDYDAVTVTARCSSCRRVVVASYGDLRETGVFGCLCGTMTRARYSAPVERSPFSHAGWHSPSSDAPRCGPR